MAEFHPLCAQWYQDIKIQVEFIVYMGNFIKSHICLWANFKKWKTGLNGDWRFDYD